MKKKKFMGIMALLLTALCNFKIPVYAEVTDYQEADTGEEETSAECQVIYKSTYDFSEEIPKYPELEVSASGYDGIYDGKAHGINVDCKVGGATILYSTDGKTYMTKKPVYTNAGTYVTYYKVEKAGYTAAIGSAVVKIKEAGIDVVSYDCNVIYDGKLHGIDLSVKTADCKILYSEDGINFTSKKPEYRAPGTYVVYYKIMKDNHETVTGSSRVIIRENKNPNNNGNQNNSNLGNNSINGNKGSGNIIVQTGDESNIMLYGTALIASASGLAILRRKREEKEKL